MLPILLILNGISMVSYSKAVDRYIKGGSDVDKPPSASMTVDPIEGSVAERTSPSGWKRIGSLLSDGAFWLMIRSGTAFHFAAAIYVVIFYPGELGWALGVAGVIAFFVVVTYGLILKIYEDDDKDPNRWRFDIPVASVGCVVLFLMGSLVSERQYQQMAKGEGRDTFACRSGETYANIAIVRSLERGVVIAVGGDLLVYVASDCSAKIVLPVQRQPVRPFSLR